MIESITKPDLALINSLSNRKYKENRLLSNATEGEKDHLKSIIRKLRATANYFKQRYDASYGPFESSVATGNPIAIGGINFKRIWSGIFKGAENKQYAAQISFVMNPSEECLDVGFYFGRASGHSLSHEQRVVLESQLNSLGAVLADSISNDSLLAEKYNALFDFGFHAFVNHEIVLAEEWLTAIRIHTKSSQIPQGFFLGLALD